MSKFAFGVTTSSEFYQLFVDSVEEYLVDALNIRKAINTSMFAFHLTEWLYHEEIAKTGKSFNSNDLGTFRKNLNCAALNIMHDVINGSKHLVLNNDKAIDQTSVHDGDYDDSEYDNEDYDVSSLQILLKNGDTTDFLTEIQIVKSFWENYFKTKSIA